jgi:hypothetical protein
MQTLIFFFDVTGVHLFRNEQLLQKGLSEPGTGAGNTGGRVAGKTKGPLSINVRKL